MKIVLFRSSCYAPALDYLAWVRATYRLGCFNLRSRPGVLGPEFQVVQT